MSDTQRRVKCLVSLFTFFGSVIDEIQIVTQLNGEHIFGESRISERNAFHFFTSKSYAKLICSDRYRSLEIQRHRSRSLISVMFCVRGPKRNRRNRAHSINFHLGFSFHRCSSHSFGACRLVIHLLIETHLFLQFFLTFNLIFIFALFKLTFYHDFFATNCLISWCCCSRLEMVVSVWSNT